MDKYLNICLRIFAAIGITVFIGSFIHLYVYDHIYFFSDIDKDVFGIYGDFIGGIVGTIFTIVATILVWLTYSSQKEELKATKDLIKNQIDLNYKPDLNIKDTKIQVYRSPVNKNFVFSNELVTNFDNDLVSKMELINIGVAVGKTIDYQLSYDLEEIKSFLDNYFSDSNFRLELFQDSNSYQFNYLNDVLMAASVLYQTDVQKIDYLLPYTEQKIDKTFVIPTLYLNILSYCIFDYLSGNKEKEIFENLTKSIEFPKMELKINCLDLIGNKIEKMFKLNIKVDGPVTLSELNQNDYYKMMELQLTSNEVQIRNKGK